MCLAVPARIEAIRGHEADVDMGGVNLRVSLMLTPDARVGDYVIVHAGYAISVMGELEARETLQLLREIDDVNQAADVERSS